MRKKVKSKIISCSGNCERAHTHHDNRFFFSGLNYPGNYVISLLCLPVGTKLSGLVGKVKDGE